MAFITDVFQSPLGAADNQYDPFGMPEPGSMYAEYARSLASRNTVNQVSAPQLSPVNYADPAPAPFAAPPSQYSGKVAGLDPDPFGTQTAKWARENGVETDGNTVLALDVFGRRMSRGQLEQSDAGRRLLAIVERRRKGERRSFWNAILDFSWEDAPFVSLFATVGKSVSDAATVSSTFRKLQNGEAVTDDELVKTRLYMAENEERENGTWGATVGDIMRAAPGFVAEFFVSGGMYSLARTGLSKLGKEGIHMGMTRATKVLAREATQEAAEKWVAKAAAKGAEGFAALAADEAAKKGVVKEVADTILRHTMRGNPMYRGLGEDALKELAKSRAEYEFGKMVARNAGGRVANGLNRFSQWLGQNVSRGLMDFGAWGTEESTVLFTSHSKATRALADAVGTFLVEAPLKGAMMWAPNQFVARPVVEALAGGRAVSSAQLELEKSAYMTGNRELMANAESMAHGLSLLEYVSENTGRGFSSLMRAAGMGLEKAGVRGLVRPATRALGVAEDKMDAVTLGGKFRQWAQTVFGSREDYVRKTTKDRVAAVARKLGVSGAADMQAIETAVLSKSTRGLRPELASRIEGGDIGKFAMSALKELTDAERKDFEYRTFGKFMVADWMARHQLGPETVINMFDRLGYDGVLGEMFEERYSDFAKGLLGWDDRADHDLWSNLKTAVKNLYPGWDQLTAEATAFAMPMVMRAGILRVQSAVFGGGGAVREVRANLEAINDAMRAGTVGAMSPGEYLAEHQRLMERDADEVAGLEEERKRQKKALDDAVQIHVDTVLADPDVRERIDTADDSEAYREKVVEDAAAEARERLSAPGGAGEALAQIDSDIARKRKVMDRRRELHDKFVASLPEAAMDTLEEIVVPLYTDDDLADDERFHRTPVITAQQANEVLAGQNAMVDYSPRLGRLLVEMESPTDGESPSWWRRAARRLVGVAGALATGDFSLAAANPVQWTARDMGLSRNVVDGLKKNMKDAIGKAREQLENARQGAVEEAGRLDGEARRAGDSGDAPRAEELGRLAAEARARAHEPTRAEVMDLAESLAAPAARRIMSANLAAHQLRSFSKTRVRDQALGIVARELGYDWFADRDGNLRFFKYSADGKTVDERSAMDAEAFLAANRAAVDDAAKGITAAAVDLLTRRMTKSGDESVRLMNAVTAPDPAELRQMAQAKMPGQVGPVAQDAVMREAALYDAAMRLVGEGDAVERVRIDGQTPLAETLDRGSLGRVNMATVDYLAGFDKAEDADQRAFDALAWSLNLPFDGTEKGLAERNAELFAFAKLVAHFNRGDKAYYSKPTPIDDEDASRLTPNGNIPLTASLVNGVWVVDYGRDENGDLITEPFVTKEEMDAKLREMGYFPDKSRIVLTLAKAVESRDMLHMIRELGLGYAYRDAMRGGNVHPALRKADGKYVYSEAEAQDVLRAELAAAEGGERAPKGSAARAAWEKVWGEDGYMRAGESLLKDHGVEKSVVAKYAGEFTDWSPAVYTLSLSAGRLSPASANVYVPVDPLVCPDIVSGVVNGLLIQSFMTHPRLLRDMLGGVVSEFAAQVRAVIDAHIAATDDKQLKADLERFRRAVVANVDRAVRGPDGTIREHRGAGLNASSYAVLASAFVLGREADYQASPHLRACAEIASDVRMCPAFPDFCDLVDLTLGGNGPISAASRMAAGAEESAESQRGLQRVMSYAAGSPGAMAEKLKEMRPLGLEPRQFLDLCMRRLTAMAKSGAQAVPQKEVETLKSEAAVASAAKPEPKAHLTFYGHLIAVVKRMLDTDLPVDVAVRDFMKDVAETAQNEPGVTEAQRKALRQMLGILTRTRVVGRVRQTYVDAFNKAKTAEQRYRDAVKARQQRGRELARAKKGGEATTSPNVYEARRREVTETRAVEQKLKEEYSRAVKEAEGAEKQVRADMDAGEAAEVLGYDAVWTRLPTEAEEAADEGEADADVDALTGDGPVERDDAIFDAEDEANAADAAVGGIDAVELPKAAALGEDKTVMSHGFTEVPVEMDRSVQRLAVNVCVRAVAMSARPGPDADPLAPVVTEDSVVAMAKKLFHLSDREADALRFQYRVADDMRMRANRMWEDYARSGVRWDFQDDDKADDDVSSDNFSNRAAAEYNSPFLADALALAARVAPESGTNLRAFVARTKEWLRMSAVAPVVPGVTKEVGGVPLVWEESSDGHVSAAWYDPKDGSIHVHAEGVRRKYASGAWKAPERSSAIPRAEELIKSADDLVAWAVYHELGHAKDKSPRDASEAGRTAREDRANAFASRQLARAKRQAAVGFAMSLLDPRLDPRGKTQAEQSALHMKALAAFDESPETVAAHVETLLAPDEGGRFPVSRRLGFLLSYMAALQTEDRRNFALLCANSVSAQAVHVKSDFKEGDFVEERRVGAGDRVSDRVVGDTFVHVLEGRPASEAATVAADLRKAQTETLKNYPRGGAKVAAYIFGLVFGRESPLCTALASNAAADHRARKGDKKVNAELAKSVTPGGGRIPIVESVAATLDALAARGEPLTADNVTAAFVALFETGRPDVDVGVRRLASGPSFTDPLKAWMSTYADSLPATILSAEVDQRRDSSGSSVPIAPRDSVPMVSRWIYSDEKAKGVIDGRVVEFPTFTELAKQAFPNATDAQIERCRQDACWPDGTPVCAKNTSSSLTTRELYLACEKAYQLHKGDAWYIPLYAGDHSSSTMLRIPWSVKMDGFMKAVRSASASASVQTPAGAIHVDEEMFSDPTWTPHAARLFRAKMGQAGGVTKIIAMGTYASTPEGNAFPDRTNVHAYAPSDVVAVYADSPDSPRDDAVPVRGTVLEGEIRLAVVAGATIVTDEKSKRDEGGKSFRSGHLDVADLLSSLGYEEQGDSGVWRPGGSFSAEVAQDFVASPDNYRDAAKAMAYAVGMNLMYTDTKRSAITSLENQGAGLIGVKDLGNLDEAAQKVAGTAAVGPDGKPLLLYHGSAGPIAAFENRNGYGTWFTNVRSQAVQFSWKAQGEPRRRSRNPSEWIPKQDLSKTNVQSFYLNIRNPKVYEPSTGTYGDAYYAFLKDFQEATGAKGKNWDTPPDQAKKFADALKAQGYDGFVIRGTMVDDEVEDQWVAFDPQQIVEAKPPEYGEHRVHIIHNWAFERGGYSFKSKNEALLGTTRMYGYGARTMKTLAKDRRSDLLKLHLISTSGRDLFFIKSLSVAISEDENDSFLDNSMNRVIEDYARSFRGDDKNSTDTYTDDDSYKIGVGNSKAILVQTADGKRQKLMAWLFSRLRDLCGAPKDASEDEVAAKFKSAYGKLTGDALDELVGDVPIVDLARTDGSEPTPMKLSELMPGVMVNAVEGLDGPCLDLSYREDGAMAYTVANVSHSSRVSNEPGRTPRNYEMDMIAAAVMLGRPEDGAPLDANTVEDAFGLVANWGLLAACVYATKPQRDAAAARSSAVEALRANGEHPDGQNVRSEVARAVWAQVRENANIPVKGVDAALVACGASVDENNRLMAHTKSRMQVAMMRGAEIFTPDEQAFFGRKFRHALCNVNMSAPGFRHAWFLDRKRFDELSPRNKFMSDREVATELARMFSAARDRAEDARRATDAAARKAAEAALLDAKKAVARLFVDHHGLPIWSDDPADRGRDERYVRQFHLADLFDKDGSFDMSALQLDGDRVHNDATGQEHILLGGTKFGFPRTPSYNAHYETVRAGLPVKETKYVDADGRERWRVGRDAMVSPDPYTNKILGTDHDGDKSKLYLLHTDRYGLADEADPADLAPPDYAEPALADNAVVALPDGKTTMRARDAYTRKLNEAGWLERVWVNPETGEEEQVPKGETPEGMYLRVSDRAKLRVSNAFVRTMFTISDSVPTAGMDGKERVSESPANRVKCLGGIAFRPVSTQPVLTGSAWNQITENAMAPVLGPGETVGDPWKAAEVSSSAEDADGARGTIVSLARTLHVAFASGQFSDLFGGRQPTGMQWLAFLNHFDGLSNATFDDIKEQICGRLGWTKGMMDTVVTELLLALPDGLPTTDQQWARVLGDYAGRVKDGKAEYWMLKASSVEEGAFVKHCLTVLGVATASKENLHAAMGIEFDEREKHWRVKNNGARLAPALRALVQAGLTDAGLDYVANSVGRSLGHNPVVGRLAHLVASGGTADDMRAFARWADKRAQLAKAQAFERAVNYLTADPGDASKFARYGSEEESADVLGGDALGSIGKDVVSPAFQRMAVATGMMYRAAGNLATVEASAVLAAVRRDEHLKRLAGGSPEAARFLFVKDAMPRWDRMGLAANRQQLPYLMSFFLRQANVAANVAGTPLADGGRLYGAVSAMAASVARWSGKESPNRGLAARVAIESLFSVMYRLMATSAEFHADGRTLPAYLRAPKDSNFGTKDYGVLGGMLKRIMPGYRSNDQEAHDRIRAMYDDVVRGNAFTKARRGQGFDAVCGTFSLSRKSLRRYMAELLPADRRRDFLERKLDFAGAMALLPEDVREETKAAIYALAGLEEFLGAKPGEAEVTPAMMFGQLLPLYSLMTSRCLGAPDPSSPSILALAPSWMYEEISAGEAELTKRCPWLVDSVVAGNWAPYLENVRKTGKKGRYEGGKWTEADVEVKDVDALAAKVEIGEDGEGHPVLPKRPDAADAAEHRENPDWRTTVDVFSDGAFRAALRAAGPSTSPAVPASAPAPGPAPKGRGAYDEKTARVAGALGLAFGTWATVEYSGGKTFTIRGKLRGTMGQGKNVVFTVDMDGKTCDSPEQVEALANSEAYGASLAECCPDLGIKDGQDFLSRSHDVRVGLVKRYGVGGATDHHGQWKFDGKGVATLVGAIRLGTSKADTTAFHEYFHGMMRVFDAVGLFSEEDKAALRKTFGKPARKGQWFNEERAAESFRKWVEGKMDAKAENSRNIFRRIYDALKGILLAIRRGFGYTDDSEANMELLFGFVAHGVAQASESRVAELSATVRAKAADRAAERSENWEDLGPERLAASLDAAYLARNDVAVATAIAQIVPPPEIENAKVSTETVAEVEGKALRRKLGDPSTPAALIEAELRNGPAPAPDTEGVDFAPGSAEAAVDETRKAVKAVTTPIGEVNDFYRAANFIHEALERSLADGGSWRAPLADIVRRYSVQRGTGIDENRDKAVVLQGLRGALEAINPGASKVLDDLKLADSLAFEAALRMYHGLDSWAHAKSKADGGTPLPPEAGSSEAAAEATQYDVSAWILSSRPLSATQTLRAALDRTEALMANVSEPVMAELLRHRKALREVLSAMDDETGLMDFRRGDLNPVFDKAFAELREGLKMNGHAPDGRLRDLTANVDGTGDYAAKGMTRALRRMESFQNVQMVPAVQESLKSALTALWRAQAQAKFYRETDVTPSTAEDMEESAQMARRHNAPFKTPAEYAAEQAIGDSNLADNPSTRGCSRSSAGRSGPGGTSGRCCPPRTGNTGRSRCA